LKVIGPCDRGQLDINKSGFDESRLVYTDSADPACPASTILANVLPQLRLLPNCLTDDVTGNGRLAVDDGTEHESLSQFSAPLP
jgi:hypothetical protein